MTRTRYYQVKLKLLVAEALGEVGEWFVHQSKMIAQDAQHAVNLERERQEDADRNRH